MASNDKVLVTSALPYVNNVPHLGNLVCVLSSDVYARYNRLKNRDVLHVCGTDEHGTTTEVKAIEEDLSPEEITDKYFIIHKEIYDWFECGFDCFGRTSSEDNKKITQQIFSELDENGYILEDDLKQTYCNNCDRFLSDRFVEGECPNCGYEDAQGDQCEDCGSLLDAVELVNPVCSICGEEAVIKESRHLFLDLPSLEPELKEWIETVKEGWSKNTVGTTKSWLDDGLEKRCITRNLDWGVSVPKEGYEDKVFYSWFDAPIGYMGITIENEGDDWINWWKDPENVKLVQFMGKDNIPFHTILFPSYLIGSNDDYTLVDALDANEYINYEGGKFSKSKDQGVFGDDVMETGLEADLWRYYIMVKRPETSDSDFEWDDFQSKVNNELVNNLGNLVNRAVTFINKYFDGEIPSGEKDSELWNKVTEKEKRISKLFEEVSLKEALKEVMSVSQLGNQYFQEEKPWEDQNPDVLYNIANLIKDLSILLEPFMPEKANLIQDQLNIEDDKKWSDLGSLSLEGHGIEEPSLLFENIEDSEIESFKEKYGS